MRFGRHKATWEVLAEDFGLREGLANAVKEVVGVAIDQGAKQLASNITNELFLEMGVAILKPFGGDVLAAAVKALLGKTDRIQTLVEKQIHAPFQTGVRMVTEAINLKGASDDSQEFRTKLLFEGIQELEKGWTLASGTRNQEEIRFHIRLLQGLAALKIPGGNEYAQPRVQSCYDSIGKWVKDIEALIEAEKQLIVDYERRALTAKTKSDSIPGYSVQFGAAAKMGYHQLWEGYQESIRRSNEKLLKSESDKMVLLQWSMILKTTGAPIG